MKIRAYADRGGTIQFGETVPKGSLIIAFHEESPLRETVSGLARRAYDNVTLLVPGVPEADSETTALDALVTFQVRVIKALG